MDYLCAELSRAERLVETARTGESEGSLAVGLPIYDAGFGQS
jgi:hypothetical protein